MKILWGAAFFAAATAVAASKTDITIGPGPKSMSEMEKSIVADAAAGIQHGVILIDETERDDNKGTSAEIGHHLRAKILSPEGRGLADIAIPVEHRESELKTFWARAILPDGTVHELREADLKSQAIVKSSAGDYRELRGAIPGVVPGCVIDYGYIVRQESFSNSERVFLQQDWPVRSFRYRWVPSKYFAAAYVLSRADGLAISAKPDSGSVLVTAHDLPTVPDEPRMPPENEARAAVTLYYTTNEKNEEYWELNAKRIETQLKSFLGGTGAVSSAVAAMNIPPGAPLEEKLKIAYDWIGANIKNKGLMSAEEEEETLKKDERDEAYNARSVLQQREGTGRQLDYLFAGVARSLGAEANVVFAVDRTDRFFNKGFKSFGQFTYTFVAIRAPGGSDESAVLVDAGSGLPYGQVPWRATGVSALVCTSKGSRVMQIPVASPVINRADTHVKLSFSEENDTMIAKWSRTANGVSGLEERRWLRNLDTRERKETLDRICGTSSTAEIVAAELPGIDEASAPYQIACDLEMSDMHADGDISRYSLSIDGAWWPDTPVFTAATRRHPVIFSYPKLDILALDVTAPHGFKPKDPPAPIELNSQYGRYALTITKTATGFHVDRAFALTVLLARVEEYPALRKYFADVERADKTALTFERAEGVP